MKTLHNWHTEKLAWNDERAKGYYHSPHILCYKGNEVVIGSGESDDISLFWHGDYIVLLSSNSRYDYAGIDVYDFNLEHIDAIFVQSLSDQLSYFDSNFFDRTPWYQATLLFNLMA